MTIIPVRLLVDEALSLGWLWLENGRLMVALPAQSQWLVKELRDRRDEVRAECERRWLQPGTTTWEN
jgi:hypothetical protein